MYFLFDRRDSVLYKRGHKITGFIFYLSPKAASMGIAERKQREQAARRELIKNSASRLFSLQGYTNTTIEQIALEAELSKATIYLYFKSKEELFFSIVEKSLTDCLDRLDVLTSHLDEPADVTLNKIKELTFEFYMREPSTIHLIRRYKTKEFRKLLSPKHHERLRSLMRTNLKGVEKIIGRGIKQGIFASTDAWVAAIIFWNIFMGVIQFQENRIDENSRDYRKPTLDQAIEYFYAGLKAGA